MAIRGSSLPGVIIPVGGPAGVPGQKGADGLTPDVSGKLDKNDPSIALASQADAADGTATTGLMTPDLTRRQIAASLAATGAGAIGGAIAGRASRALDNADFPSARANLGLREINAADPQFGGGVVPDCTDVGVGTDNGPRLQLAVNAWIAAGPGSVLKVPRGRYRITTPVSANLGGQVGMVLDAGDALLTPDPVAMVAVSIRNGFGLILRARLLEGGPFAGWGASSPYPVDYGSIADVVSGGGQEAIRISGVSGYTVDLTAQNYAGRLLRIATAAAGEPMTSGIKGRIVTTRGTDLSKPRVGQSLFTDNGTGAATGAWGQLDSLHNDFDAFGPIWRDVNDVAVTYLDGAYAYTGVGLHGVGIVHGASWYIGDVDSNASNTHLDFAPSPATGRAGYRLALGQLTMLNAGNGLSISDTDPSQRAADIALIRMVGASSAFGTALKVDSAKGVSARVEVGGLGDAIAAVTGAASDDVRLSLHAAGLTGNFATIAPEVTGRVQIGGALANPVAGRSVLYVGGDTPVRLSDLDVSGPSGPSLLNFASATNKVRWVSGSKSGAATTYAASPPAYVSPAVDLP